MEDLNDIKNLFALSEREILIAIGNDILAEESRFLPPSTQKAIQKAMNWLEENYELLQAATCGNTYVWKYYTDNEDIMLAAAIADLISGICLNLSPFSVAVLLVKKGIGEFCKYYWEVK